jgi:hypothetical protein
MSTRGWGQATVRRIEDKNFGPGGGFKNDNFWNGGIQGKIRHGGNTPTPLRYGNDLKRVQVNGEVGDGCRSLTDWVAR